MMPAANDLKVFVPTKDFDLSIRFYTELGWQLNWRDENGLAEIELAGVRLYLQQYYQQDWANNFMIYLEVPDAEAWYEHTLAVLNSGLFVNAKVQAPKEEAYGALVTYIWDPCGVLIHAAQRREGAEK